MGNMGNDLRNSEVSGGRCVVILPHYDAMSKRWPRIFIRRSWHTGYRQKFLWNLSRGIERPRQIIIRGLLSNVLLIIQSIYARKFSFLFIYR